MHVLSVARVLLRLLAIVALFMLFPIVVAVVYDELDLIPYFAVPIAATLVGAWLGIRLLRRASDSLSTRDGFLLVAMSWVVVSAVSCLPFYLSGSIPSFTDAYFETMSGFTTTGASILTDIEALPRSMLFWRSLTHWLGGMGIVVLTVAILPFLGVGAYQLIKAEAPGPSLDKITPKITQTAKVLWIIYVVFTVLETVLLMAGGMDLFDALTHTFGTLATGGFSPKAASVGHYDSAYIDAVITIFMVAAGINFALYFRAISTGLGSAFTNAELRWYLGIFAIATVAVAIALFGTAYDTFGESLRYASFQVASILTTTGYATTDFAAWPYAAQIGLFALMFIGGCSGSTGGGIKVVRIAVLFKLGAMQMKRLSHPRGVFAVRLGGDIIREETIGVIAGFFLLYIMLLVITTVVVASGGHDILTSFSSALVTVGNIGPGFGRVGPVENYQFYQDYIKWFLSFAMLVGRLEVYTVLILFSGALWRK
jgi:trk system potassium uptake protein TrkH